jgi:cytochrome o ubiquinol oxidase subunit 2
VPQLGGQIYTMAGMVTQLYLQADYVGTYRGMSANYSGAGFSDMYFNVNAVPAEKFAQWVVATRDSGPVLDAQSYAALAKPSQAVAPFSYRAVAPDLFKSILTNLTTVMQSGEPLCLAFLPSQRAEK